VNIRLKTAVVLAMNVALLSVLVYAVMWGFTMQGQVKVMTAGRLGFYWDATCTPLVDVNLNVIQSTHPKTHSEIMDMPRFPDDEEPKSFKSEGQLSAEWIPWLGGITYTSDGSPMIFFISAQLRKTSFGFTVKDKAYSGSIDVSVRKYSNGVLTLGYMPKLAINYITHNVLLYLRSTIYLNITANYRGPPLWYSKTTDPADMVALGPNTALGGWDGPVTITGTFMQSGHPTTFSGYGVWERTWLVGPWIPTDLDRRWAIINDPKLYGVVLLTLSKDTGEVLTRTGRIGIVNGDAFRFDDFIWSDDGGNPPKYIHIRGRTKDVAGNFRDTLGLSTNPSMSFSVFDPIWTWHLQATGTLNEQIFDGVLLSEVHKIWQDSIGAPGSEL